VPILVYFGRPRDESFWGASFPFGIFIAILIYFVAIGMFVAFLVHFPKVGFLHQEKYGNLDRSSKD
jgi:hypothetical protein